MIRMKEILSILSKLTAKKTKIKVRENKFRLEFVYIILILFIALLMYISTNSLTKTLIITSINFNIFCVINLINQKKNILEIIDSKFQLYEKIKLKEQEQNEKKYLK